MVETEHELVALLGVEDGIVPEVFAELGITSGPVRELVRERLGPGPEQQPEGYLPFSPPAKKVLELTLRVALDLGYRQIGPEHVLLGLVAVREGGAHEIFRAIGVDAESIGREVLQRVPEPDHGRQNMERLLRILFGEGPSPAGEVREGRA